MYILSDHVEEDFSIIHHLSYINATKMMYLFFICDNYIKIKLETAVILYSRF